MEAKAVKLIQSKIKNGDIELVSSYVLEYENENNPFLMKRLYIENFIEDYSSIYVSESKEKEIKTIAKGIIDTGVKKHDAYHIACALIAECDYFLTTDKRVLKYKNDRLLLLNPMEFVESYGGKNNDH
ncbi:MAG: hypothetical protein IJ631_04550 [Schwartzia sp.]|nr:hypothetical protein [Schwartzia sp. (in: firmicutes)]